MPAGQPVYKVGDYIKNGSTQNVSIPYDNFTIVEAHSHPPQNTTGQKLVDGPSPLDISGVYNVWSSGKSRRFVASFMISGDSLHNEYAVAMTDTAAAKTFWTAHPINTVINTDTTSLQKNNWSGDIIAENSYYSQYIKAYLLFQKEGYPKKYLEDYANILMLCQNNMGIKVYRKVNGVFKEMNVIYISDSQGIQHVRITICQ